MTEKNKTYRKVDGVLPKTPFTTGDIVVYQGKHVKDIILLNRVNAEAHGDIFYNTKVSFCKYEVPYLVHNSEKEDWRNWFNGDTLRLASREEIATFVKAILGNLRNGIFDFDDKEPQL